MVPDDGISHPGANRPPAIADEDARRVLWELSIASAGVGSFDWDLTTGQLHWDERLVEQFGYDPLTFGRTIADFNARVHPADLPEVTERLSRAVQTGGDFECEYRIVLPSGTVRWISAKGRTLRGESGATERLLGATLDITGTRAGEAALAAVHEAMNAAFYSLDHSWRFTYVNAEAERLLQHRREDLLGGDLWELFPATVGSAFESHYRQAMGGAELVTFEAYYPPPLDGWYELRVLPTEDGVSVYFLDITDRHRARELAEAGARRARLLGRITEDLLHADDPQDAAGSLAQLVCPDLADWAIVTLTKDGHATSRRRGLRTAAAAHADPERQPDVEVYSAQRLGALHDDALVVRVMETGSPEFLDAGATQAALAMLDPGPAREAMARLAPEHIAVYPLTGRGGTVGILTLCRSAGRGPFTEGDRATAVHIAARAGVVLDNARLYRQQRDLAEGLQRSLLTAPPEPDHMQVVVRYAPAAQAAQVGGDWYDAFLQPSGATMLVIGDVVGHDTQAAAAMSQVRTLVRGISVATGCGPAALLASVDQAMETLMVATTATAITARLEQTPEERERGLTRLRWSNAGHPPAMVITTEGTVTALGELDTDLLLGVMPHGVRREHETTLDRGATVLMYTDGLVERRGQTLDVGLQRLAQVLGELARSGVDLDGLCDGVLARMLPEQSEDDVALVAVRLHPQDEPRPPQAGPQRLPVNVSPEI